MDEWRIAAEATLSAAWGGSVSCEITEVLRDKGRNRVLRLAVRGGPADCVVLKACVGGEGAPYVAGDATPGGPFQRLIAEWAGAQMLAPLGLGPRPLALDVEHGFCVLEDLGGGDTLADRLTGDDPAKAQAALFAYAGSLGDMHAATRGQIDRWNGLVGAHGVAGGVRGPLSIPWATADTETAAFCAELGIDPPASLARDLAAIGAALADPGPYLAFTPADCCPDNHFLRGERVVFFDCEGASMRHALLDAAYFLAPFPTCWCCGALPEGLPDRLISAYRERFPGADDFDDQLTLMLAAWLTQGVIIRRATDWMNEDTDWGLSTARQRVLAMTRNLLARPGLTTVLPGLGELLARMEATLGARWRDLAPMPAYPAFH